MQPKVKATPENETFLCQYILEHPNERGHIKSQCNIINWEAFARRWEYHCRVGKKLWKSWTTLFAQRVNFNPKKQIDKKS